MTIEENKKKAAEETTIFVVNDEPIPKDVIIQFVQA